jgi:hypothetical protein
MFLGLNFLTRQVWLDTDADFKKRLAVIKNRRYRNRKG